MPRGARRSFPDEPARLTRGVGVAAASWAPTNVGLPRESCGGPKFPRPLPGSALGGPVDPPLSPGVALGVPRLGPPRPLLPTIADAGVRSGWPDPWLARSDAGPIDGTLVDLPNEMAFAGIRLGVAIGPVVAPGFDVAVAAERSDLGASEEYELAVANPFFVTWLA